MSAADIYSQYLSDYEDAAKKYNRSARAYTNTTDFNGGPIRAQTPDGQNLGLYSTPDGSRQVVKQGTSDDYQKAYEAANAEQRQAFGQYIDGTNGAGSWSVREGQNGNAIHSFGGWQGGEGYYKDLGGGMAASRSGGRGTGQYVTERIEGDEGRIQQLLDSGKYKDVKMVRGPSTDSEGNGTNGLIDVTYEQMKFPDAPGEFNAKKPSLSMAQMREIANPTPTMADLEKEGAGEAGLIESARAKYFASSPAAGLIQRNR